MGNIVIVGASGHGKVVADVVAQAGTDRVVGWIDAQRPLGESYFGYPVVGSEADLPRVYEEHGGTLAVMVAVGDNWVRHQLVERLVALVPDLNFATAVHPGARIGQGVELGAGTVVMAGAVVNPAGRVGQHCIVNTGSSLDHDGVMGDFSSLAPGVVTGGNVVVGEYSAISLGARLIHGVGVGPHSVIGAGATVLGDVPSHCCAWGTPARVMRSRKVGEKYL